MGIARSVETTEILELHPNQPIERLYLSVVRVSRQHEINTVARRVPQPMGTVVQQ